MWPVTQDMLLWLAYDRQRQLLAASMQSQRAKYMLARRPRWQCFLGCQLVKLGDRLIVWGANLKRETEEYSDATSLTTVA